MTVLFSITWLWPHGNKNSWAFEWIWSNALFFMLWLFFFFALVLFLFINYCPPTDKVGDLSHFSDPQELYADEDYLKTNSLQTGRNILAIYTGRWKFIRVQLPHVYRELRGNGGVLDEVCLKLEFCMFHSFCFSVHAWNGNFLISSSWTTCVQKMVLLNNKVTCPGKGSTVSW